MNQPVNCELIALEYHNEYGTRHTFEEMPTSGETEYEYRMGQFETPLPSRHTLSFIFWGAVRFAAMVLIGMALVWLANAL